MLDGQLDRGFDPLADAAHQGRLVHGHQNHNGQVLPVPGEPAVVLAVFGAVVAHLGQRGVEQQRGEEQEHLLAAAVPPGWSHAATEQGDRVNPPPPHHHHRRRRGGALTARTSPIRAPPGSSEPTSGRKKIGEERAGGAAAPAVHAACADLAANWHNNPAEEWKHLGGNIPSALQMKSLQPRGVRHLNDLLPKQPPPNPPPPHL